MNQLASDRTPAPAGDAVELVLPLGHRHIATARVVAASVGADVGLDVDQIDDLRLGVDEAVAVMVEAQAAPESTGGRVAIRFSAEPDTVTVHVRVLDVPAVTLTRNDIDPLALRIIEAVADRFDVVDGALVISKRTTAGDGA